LKNFNVVDVIAKGKHVAHNNTLLVELPSPTYPDWVLNTVNPKYLPRKEDFFIEGPKSVEKGTVHAHIIGVIEHSLVTNHFIEEVKIENNRVVLEDGRDLAYYFLLDRHGKTTHFAKSLVKGFNFQVPAAVASTVAHDSHQLLMTGNDAACMEFAMNTLVESKGGQIIVMKNNDDSFDYKLLPLPYAGLMSIEKPEIVAEIMLEMKEFSQKVCPGISEPFMSLSFMALPVIPKLKLSDLGLVDVDKFEVIDIFN